jgi:hypothetical protein
MRSLVLRVDARIIETLVEHALAGPIEMARRRAAELAPVVDDEAEIVGVDAVDGIELN